MDYCRHRILQYNSVRLIRVRNWKLALIHRAITLIVILYVILGTIMLDKGYQVHDEATGTVSTKVKGTGSIGDFNNWTNAIVYDAMDVIHPPVESNALFITTSFVSTPLQTRGICNGNEDIDECETDDDCEENEYNWKSQGILTGKCGSNGRCLVSGWCPLENDSIRTVINNVGAFTIFVKNDIRFPNFNIETTNARDYENTGSLTFGKNLFALDDILADATAGEFNTSMLATKGAIVLIDIDWSCNLDFAIEDCIPDFTFERIDNDGDGIVSEGFNFRTVVYENNSTVRELKKLYGVRLTFTSSGTAGMFNFVALTITLGAGIAYLGVSKLIADLVLTRFMSNTKKYKAAKYLRVHSKKLLAQQKSKTNLSVLENELAAHVSDHDLEKDKNDGMNQDKLSDKQKQQKQDNVVEMDDVNTP